MNLNCLGFAILLALVSAPCFAQSNQPISADVAIYGATPAGIAAALTAAEGDRRVVLIEPTARIGGMTTHGLSHTDFHTFEAINGPFLQFSQRVLEHYEKTYGKDSAQVRDCWRGTHGEPSVNLLVFQQMIAEKPSVRVLTERRLAKVTVVDQSITSLIVTRPDGSFDTIEASMVIDASYEGDLLAAADVPYRVGREARSEYGESLAPDQADAQVQGYNFRFCMTQDPENRVPVPVPPNYNREDYAALVPLVKADHFRSAFGYPGRPFVFKAHLPILPNGKHDINDVSKGLARLSLPGRNQDYPDGDLATRRRIEREHLDWQLGLIHFVQTDPALPESFRQEAATWGLCRDEFTDTEHIPPQIYVREARRMVGLHVYTEADTAYAPNDARSRLHHDSIAAGEYSHNCHGTGHEGPTIGGRHTGEFYKGVAPYQIPYGVIVPATIRNLLVPTACSASHVGFCALRLEPTWMSLGGAAGHAADLAIEANQAVQQIEVETLQRRIWSHGGSTIHISDVPPGHPEFTAVQWWGGLGGFHGLEPPPSKPGARGKRIVSQYYEAFPGHAALLDRPLDDQLRKQWTALAKEHQLVVPTEATTRGAWIRKIFATAEKRAAQRAITGHQGDENVDARTDLPPLLEFLDGRPVGTPAEWVERREEIQHLLTEHFVGSFPDPTPEIIDTQIVSDRQQTDGSTRRRIRLTLQTPGHASMEMALWTPAGEGPFPLLLTAPRDYQLAWAEDALARGYAVCLFPGVDSHHQEPDFPEYESVWETFRREYPEATWTEISTKGWLASRCLDYLLSDQSVARIHPEQVAIIGFSRYGKMAMIAAAFDPRIGCVVARSPGSPASSPYRLTSRNTFAETPADFPGEWFLPSLKEYYGREHRLPIDAHGWYALIAPRPCLIHTAHHDGSEPTFAVEKAWLEGRTVYRFLHADQNLHVDYRPGGHRSSGPEKISADDRKRNLDWIDLAFARGSATKEDFPEIFLHNFDWDQWRSQQLDHQLAIDSNAPVVERLKWMLGEEPESIDEPDSPEFLTTEESDLMTHDRWKPEDIHRVPIRFGEGVRGNLYFKPDSNEPMPVVVWLHPFSYHSGYNEGYGVQGTTVYNRLAQQGYAVIAYDQCGFGLRLLEGTRFYDQYPRWSRMGRMVRDAQAAVSFAVEGKGRSETEIPELDSTRVYLLGYSMGALTAMYAGALDDRVAGTACFGGWSPLRSGDNRRLWYDHALLPRLGLYAEQPAEIPIDFDEWIPVLARKPTLIVTPQKDRFADHGAIASLMAHLSKQQDTITSIAPNTSDRFQAKHHEIFLRWCESLSAAGKPELNPE